MQDLEKQLKNAQQLIENGEIDACYNLCLEIEKEINLKKNTESSMEFTFLFEKQKKEIFQRLNQLMIKGIRQKI